MYCVNQLMSDNGFSSHSNASEGEEIEAEGNDGNVDVVEIDSPGKEIEDHTNYTEAVCFDQQPLSTDCKKYFYIPSACINAVRLTDCFQIQ